MIHHSSDLPRLYFIACSDGILLCKADTVKIERQRAGMMQILRKVCGKLETCIALLQSNAHKCFAYTFEQILYASHVMLCAVLWNYIQAITQNLY